MVEIRENDKQTAIFWSEHVLRRNDHIVKRDIGRSGRSRVRRLDLLSLDTFTSRNEERGQSPFSLMSAIHTHDAHLGADGKVVCVHTTSDPFLCTVDRPDISVANKTTYQVLPSLLFVAVHFRPATSDPANASEMARAMYFCPEKTSSRILDRRGSLAKLSTGGRPMTMPDCRPSP